MSFNLRATSVQSSAGESGVSSSAFLLLLKLFVSMDVAGSRRVPFHVSCVYVKRVVLLFGI